MGSLTKIIWLSHVLFYMFLDIVLFTKFCLFVCLLFVVLFFVVVCLRVFWGVLLFFGVCFFVLFLWWAIHDRTIEN